MLDPDKLRVLLDLLIEKDIHELEHETTESSKSERLKIVRGAVVTQAPMHAAPIAARSAPAVAVIVNDEDHIEVTSPFVGTFYRAPSPDAPVFADIGTVVRPGQTICIIEAMKLMNEIEAEVSGTVVEIFVQNGKAVEYGQKLFRLKKA
jgi:acetyl-CoA carboxylase biotin carboxyl carrier protein